MYESKVGSKKDLSYTCMALSSFAIKEYDLTQIFSSTNILYSNVCVRSELYTEVGFPFLLANNCKFMHWILSHVSSGMVGSPLSILHIISSSKSSFSASLLITDVSWIQICQSQFVCAFSTQTSCLISHYRHS